VPGHRAEREFEVRTHSVLVSAALAALCAASLAAQNAPPAAQEDELASPKLRIAWADFKPLYDAAKVVVVDVRGEQAYATGHIPGARLVPLEKIESQASELKKLDKPIVLYCS
jgi:3-mercaptopyruvate sulfurtransferase SseA